MRINLCIRLLLLMVCLTCVAQRPAHGAEPVKIGVLAFRPKPQILAQWLPLAAVLKQAMPERDFVVEAFSYPELEQAVAARRLDFVLTNSGHYVLLKKRSGLSSPLATVIEVNKNGPPSVAYGGVIFCRAGQAGINTLQDIKGKTVAAVSSESLGGYQMQAYELSRVMIRVERDATMLTTGMPHDKVVEAVLSGRAEVGFVRSGVLEGMERDGMLDSKQLKILNRQNLPGFPQQVSTRLYPEWPFAAMPHTDEDLARRVAAALFMLGDNTAATRAMGIRGFTVPADYSPVEELLRELRLPPFDLVPSFTMRDIWLRYRWQLLGGLFATGMILFLGAQLLFANRRLAAKQQLLLQQQVKLQDSEERFRALVESTSDWIWELDRDGRYTYASPTVESLLGYKPEEMIGKSPFDFMLPDEVQRVSQVFNAVVASGVPFVSLENVNLHKEGRLVVLETSGVPFFDRNKEVAGYRGIDRDITERKRMETEIVKARNIEALGVLAGGIAHDFNNLLYVIFGNIELAKSELPESSKALPILEKVEELFPLATKLTGQLITFSSGGNLRATNIRPASHIKEEADAILEGAGLVAEYDLAEDLWLIRVDPFQFRNVIQQMVLNAREAMLSESRGRIRIMAANASLPEHHQKHSTLAPGRYVKISIEDNGCGISRENLPRIFDPYFSTKPRGAQKGMGLGLTLCDTIIKKCGGAITVESGLGKGTIFHIHIPAVEEEVA